MPCIKRPSINDSINIVITIINVVFATCVVQYLTKCNRIEQYYYPERNTRKQVEK